MKYVLGMFGVILVCLIAILLIFNRGSNRPRQEGPRRIVISEQNKEGTSVRMTEQGRLVGQGDRRAIAIHISQNERRLEILTGYEEKLLSSQTYPNTPAAYETFLRALEQAGFGRERRTLLVDERGACPLGRRHVYELRDKGEELIRLWGTSCGTREGSFGGNAGVIQQLFQLQIPDYRERTVDVRLGG